MPSINTRADGLRLELSGTEIRHLAVSGTIPGVRVLLAAGRNGPGAGSIRSNPSGTALSWKAPGSNLWGPWVFINGNGDWLLEDGGDSGKWLRVRVYAAYLPAEYREGRVMLQDIFDNAIAKDDVIAAEASAGAVEDYSFTLSNVSGQILYDVRAWLDVGYAFGGAALETGSRAEDESERIASSILMPFDGSIGHRGLQPIAVEWPGWSSRSRIRGELLRLDPDKKLQIGVGAGWFAPDFETHPDVISWSSIAVGGTETLQVRRTVTAGAAADAEILNRLHFAWSSW